jgi:hypothetical protein
VNYSEIAADVQRLREERQRFDIEQLIVDVRELDMNEAVERVRKFLDDHRS